MNAFAAVVLCICAMSIARAGHAQETPVWEKTLQAQLLAEHQCELNFMTNVRMLDLGDFEGIDARAHCVDGRAFDATTEKNGRKFDIRACKPVEC